MKVYILLEKVFNYDGMENTDSYIDGVFNTEEKAVECMNKEIQTNIDEYGFIRDEEDNPSKEIHIIFYAYQENWQNYIEYEIVEKEVL